MFFLQAIPASIFPRDDGTDFDLFAALDDIESLLNSCNAIVMKNSDQAASVVQVNGAAGFEALLTRHIPDVPLFFTVYNYNLETNIYCPYIAIGITRVSDDIPVNHRLMNLLSKIGVPMPGISKCEVAVAVGMDKAFGGNLCSIPFSMYSGIDLTPDLEVDEEMAVVEVPFITYGACKECSVTRVKCSMTYPCTRCTGNRVCEMSDREDYRRAKVGYAAMAAGEIEHSDYGKYQLHIQTIRYRMKSFMPKVDVLDIYKRVANLGAQVPPPMNVKALPNVLIDLINGNATHKIEWMYEGGYCVIASPTYEKEIMSADEIYANSLKGVVPPKAADTMRMLKPSDALGVWFETLAIPGNAVVWKGLCVWRDGATTGASKTTIRMCSSIISFNCCITVTTMSRSLKRTL